MMNRIFRLLPTLLALPWMLMAHPMGNFSVNHYSKIRVTPAGVDLEYVLDLAEIPTSSLLSDWNVDRNAAEPELQKLANKQAREWLTHLKLTVDGAPVSARFQSCRLVIADGAGGLPILRITTNARVASEGGRIAFEDENFPDRTGWKEIVVDQAAGTKLIKASQTNTDLSHALTQYPADATIAPPQDLRAEITWANLTVAKKQEEPRRTEAAAVIAPVQQPKTLLAAASPATMTAAAAPAGSVVKGDFLSRLLHRQSLTPGMILLALGVAFLLGGAHALTPGHGKAIVAAYLVGSRGTMKHAAFLGGMVTFTHTIVVFLMGIATLFLYRFLIPEKITEVLGTLSGLSIVAVGGWMLWKRLGGAGEAKGRAHSHSHSHHGGHSHHHGPAGHGHSHVPDEISWKGLAALGISGGLVPCESALVLLLGAIALNKVALGLLLLLSFSLGLAAVLVLIGILVLYAKNLLPANNSVARHPWLRWATIASPAIVMIVGIVMTGVSMGLIQSKWMIG